MCHSVEMYLPSMTRSAAEHRIGQTDFAAAERERRVVDAGLGLIGRLKRLAGRLVGKTARHTCVHRFVHLSNMLKNKLNLFEHDSWLGKRESHQRQNAVKAEPVMLKVPA